MTDNQFDKKCPGCGSYNTSEVAGWREADKSYERFENCSLLLGEDSSEGKIIPLKGVWFCLSCNSLFDGKTVICVKE